MVRLEPDACGLLGVCTVDGRTSYLFLHRAAKRERNDACKSLASSGFAVVDHFLGAETALRVREQGIALYKQQPGDFKTGAVGGGHDGDGQAYSHAAVRGDRMTILEAKDRWRLPLLETLCESFDALVRHLGEHGGGRCPDLRAVDQRSSPMFAVYPGGGSRYMQHVDNPDGNGRVLTMLYYLNPGWSAETDGGCLRLMRGDGSASVGEERGGTLPELARVAPVLDRVVLFWSDARVPHEVLPAYRERLAISVWYHAPDAGGTAAMRAVAKAAAATSDDKAAWERARLLASGPAEEVSRQQRQEEACMHMHSLCIPHVHAHVHPSRARHVHCTSAHR